MIRKTLLTLLALPLFAFAANTVLPLASAYAQEDINVTNGPDVAKPTNTPDDLFGENGAFRTISNVLLFLIGAISVIMIIIGGIRYTTSNGDPGAVKGAKDTILYSIIGIIVAILGFAIVSFVVGAFTSSN